MPNAQLFIDENYPKWKRRYYDQLYLTNNKLEGKLDLREFVSLEKLACSNNQLTSLNLTNNKLLTEIYCSNNKLVELDLSQNSKLTKVICNNNQLNRLVISNDSQLTLLSCQFNNLTELDLTQSIKLTELNCQVNQLTSLDLSKNVQLTCLLCVNNKLTKLNTSKNTELTSLSCFNNNIYNLDLSNNPKLLKLECFDNLLHIPNGIKISKKVEYFGAYPLCFLLPLGKEVLKFAIYEEWKKLAEEKYNDKDYPEMKLINISDLNDLVSQRLYLSILGQNEYVLSYFVPEAYVPKIISSNLSLRIILDNLSNRILGRCLIAAYRLMFNKQKKFEEFIGALAVEFQKCWIMSNYWHPKLTMEKRTELVNEVINGNKELMLKISDLKFIKLE